MKTLLRSALLGVCLVSVGLTAKAQVLTAQTVSGFDPATAYNDGAVLLDTSALTQTFTNVTSVEEITFRFIATSAATFAATDLTYTFGTWFGNDGLAQTGTGLINITDDTTWTDAGSYQYFDADLDLSSFATGLNAALTYGLTIYGNAFSSSFRLAGASTPYADGGGFIHTGVADSFITVSSGGAGFANDFSFDASSNLAAVPEASGVAVLFAGLFVGGLMFRRRRHIGSLPAQA